jgi:cytochrome c oxidase subunit 3
MALKRRHLFHLVSPSPWPFMASLSVFLFVSGLAFFMHRIVFGGIISLCGLISLGVIAYNWFRDVSEEASFCGYHTLVVRRGLIFGFFLFISSEVMLFFGFF